MKRYGSAKVLSFDEFNELFEELRSARDYEIQSWKQRIGTVTGAYKVKGLSEQSNDEIVHTIRVEVSVRTGDSFFNLLKSRHFLVF